MILALLYFLLITWLIYKLPFFKDEQLSSSIIITIISVKVFAAAAYYYIYFMASQSHGDSYDTLTGAEVMYTSFHHNWIDYIKMLFGLHNELDTDTLYKTYFEKINDWSDGKESNYFLLNDNRTSIRLNAFIRLFSGGYYAVHALVMLLLSFAGQWAFYKAFKNYFMHKEKWFAAIVFLTPSILFWSSGVLKEPIALFFTGFFLLSFFKLFIYKEFKLKTVFVFITSILGFFTIKPYILVILVIPLMVFYCVNQFNVKKIGLFYVLAITGIVGVSVFSIKFFLKKDVIQVIVTRQNDFINLSNGGIFFINNTNYLRLDHRDTAQYTLINKQEQLYQIKPHTKLMYWKIKHDNDTIFVNDNMDTTLYRFVSYVIPAGSAIPSQRLEYSVKSFAQLIPMALYNVVARPYFIHNFSLMKFLATLENALIICFFMCCFIFRKKQHSDYNLLFLCLSIVVLSFLLIGLTTTVFGAIVRYKVPFLPFLMMIALIGFDADKWQQFLRVKKAKWFKH